MSFLLLQDGTSKLLLQNGTDRLLLQATDAGGFQPAWAEEDDEDGEADVAMQKNVAGQKVGRQMVSATDGSAFTGVVTVYVTGDAGTQAIGSVGSGVCTHEGNGYHTYSPSQSETNYDLIAFTFIGTGAVPKTKEVSTRFDLVDAPNITAVAAIQNGLATPTNITGGTITTVTNLTNAPTNGDFTATMKSSITTAATSATPSVTVSDKTGFSLSSAGVQAIWDALTSALTTVGSIGKLLVDNINATISSRLASASYTAPPTAADNAAGIQAYYAANKGSDGNFARAIMLGEEPIFVSTVTNATTPSDQTFSIDDGDGSYNSLSFGDHPMRVTQASGFQLVTPAIIQSSGATGLGDILIGVYEAIGFTPVVGDKVEIFAKHVHSVDSIAIATQVKMDASSTKLATINTNVSTLLSRITSTLFSGMTSLPAWLRLLGAKAPDTGTRSEFNNSGANTYNETTDSQEATRERGDAAWTTGAGGGGSTTVSVVVPAAVAAASTEEDEIVAYRGDYLARSWTNLGDFSAVTEVWFTVKDDPKRIDSEAYLQIKQTVGLTYLSQSVAAVGDVSKASITIDDAATGDITIIVDAELMAQLPPAKNWFFDIQIQQPSLTKTSTIVAGKWNLKADVTRSIS